MSSSTELKEVKKNLLKGSNQVRRALEDYARDHTTADGLDYIATWNAAMLDGEAIRASYMAQAQGEKPEYDALLPVKKTAGE